jgi:hypothetical protein
MCFRNFAAINGLGEPSNSNRCTNAYTEKCATRTHFKGTVY